MKRSPIKPRSRKQQDKQKALRKLFEEVVLPRDGYRCVRCGKTGERLDPAHYLSRNVAPEFFLDPDNLCSLDRGCHTLTEEHRVPDWNCFKPARHEWEERRDRKTLPHQLRTGQ